MATLHPQIDNLLLTSAGAYRERDILRLLESGLPAGYDVYHSIGFSTTHNDKQYYGELDVLVLTPAGHLIALEVKAGQITLSDEGLFKQYKTGIKNVHQQVNQQRGTWFTLLKSNGFSGVTLHHFLVLPDQMIIHGSAAFPRERIIDSNQVHEIGYILQHSTPFEPVTEDTRIRLAAFIENKFELIPDPSVRIGQTASANKILAEGLATWVPRIHHSANVYQIKGTAGSGKTQLALTLLREASILGKRSAYICYNRPLADHIAKIAPTTSIVSNFDDLAVSHYRRLVGEIKFDERDVFKKASQAYLKHLNSSAPTLDLLVIDESQDFDAEWLSALASSVNEDGKLYTLSDESQLIYERERFDISNAVTVECNENFRSPKRIVDVINALQLTDTEIRSRSVHQGDLPEFIAYDESNEILVLESCIQKLLSSGYTKEQITLLSYRGRESSKVLKLDSIAGYSITKFTGNYDSSGSPIYTSGDIFCETVYRFKGQSSAVIIFCEIDFQEVGPRDLRKLFVGMSRAQYHLVCVISQQAETKLFERLNKP
jgi:thymidine kinase